MNAEVIVHFDGSCTYFWSVHSSNLGKQQTYFLKIVNNEVDFLNPFAKHELWKCNACSLSFPQLELINERNNSSNSVSGNSFGAQRPYCAIPAAARKHAFFVNEEKTLEFPANILVFILVFVPEHVTVRCDMNNNSVSDKQNQVNYAKKHKHPLVY